MAGQASTTKNKVTFALLLLLLLIKENDTEAYS